MEIQYVYQKKRSEFGRQCLFMDKGPELIDNFASNKDMLQRYIQRFVVPINFTLRNFLYIEQDLLQSKLCSVKQKIVRVIV